MPDGLFSQPELAPLYDVLDPDRADLERYAQILEEVGGKSVLDVGCGTGTFALMLAARGITVAGLDAAQASLDVARSKPGADRVRWILGDAAMPLSVSVDAVTMTGNVAQVFLSDEEWHAVLQSCRHALRPGGFLIFETRDPEAQAWLTWNCEGTYRTARIDGVGEVACWEEVLAVEWPTVTFQTSFVFPGDSMVTSTSTLRFRSREEVTDALRAAQFEVVECGTLPIDRVSNLFSLRGGAPALCNSYKRRPDRDHGGRPRRHWSRNR